MWKNAKVLFQEKYLNYQDWLNAGEKCLPIYRSIRNPEDGTYTASLTYLQSKDCTLTVKSTKAIDKETAERRAAQIGLQRIALFKNDLSKSLQTPAIPPRTILKPSAPPRPSLSKSKTNGFVVIVDYDQFNIPDRLIRETRDSTTFLFYMSRTSRANGDMQLQALVKKHKNCKGFMTVPIGKDAVDIDICYNAMQIQHDHRNVAFVIASRDHFASILSQLMNEKAKTFHCCSIRELEAVLKPKH